MSGEGLRIGDEAPDFVLRDQFGQDVRLSDFRGRKAVALMFYPFAFTGVCTGELSGVRDRLDEFTGAVPRESVDSFLRGLLPSEADKLVEKGDEASIRRALELEPDHPAARAALTRMESAGDPALACVLVGLGVTSLSMSAPSLPLVRAALAKHTLEQCREAAAAARAEDAGFTEAQRQ